MELALLGLAAIWIGVSIVAFVVLSRKQQGTDREYRYGPIDDD